MKILMTSETFLPRIGGGEMHVWYLIRHLRDKGHAVVLLTNEQTSLEETRTASTFPDPPHVTRIPWSRKNLFDILSFLWKEARTADVIHAHYSYRLAAFAGIVGRIRRVPVVVTLHGLGTLPEAGARPLYRAVHALYRYTALTLASRVISTSDDLAQVAYLHVTGSKKKTEIIFNGIDASLFARPVALPRDTEQRYEGKKVILTVRRLVPKNGVHFLVEAMPLILKRVPNAHLVMLGGGRLLEHIRERIASLGIASSVDMVGDVENDKVPPYLSRANVIVFPSTAESTSIACAEAMAMGTPVVASRVGGLVELLGTNEERGRLVTLVDWQGSNYDAPLELPAERYEALAEVVASVLKTGETARASTAQEFAKKELDWPYVTEKTITAYKTAGARI